MSLIKLLILMASIFCFLQHHSQCDYRRVGRDQTGEKDLTPLLPTLNCLPLFMLFFSKKQCPGVYGKCGLGISENHTPAYYEKQQEQTRSIHSVCLSLSLSFSLIDTFTPPHTPHPVQFYNILLAKHEIRRHTRYQTGTTLISPCLIPGLKILFPYLSPSVSSPRGIGTLVITYVSGASWGQKITVIKNMNFGIRQTWIGTLALLLNSHVIAIFHM